MSELFTDNFSLNPYWLDDVPTATEHLDPAPDRADVVVIGSGYTRLQAWSSPVLVGM